MALPSNFATRRVTGHWTRFDGQPDSGTVTLTPSVSHVYDAAADVVVTKVPLSVKLSNDGTILDSNNDVGFPVPVTDDPDLEPTFSYRLEVKLKSGYKVSLDIEVPASTDPLDLLTVVPVAPVEETTELVTSVNGESGAVTLDYNEPVFPNANNVFAPAANSQIGVIIAGVGAETGWIYGVTTTWDDLLASDNAFFTENSKGLPPGTASFKYGLHTLSVREHKGHLYGVFLETTSDGSTEYFKVYRAPLTSNIGDPFSWEGPLLQMHDQARPNDGLAMSSDGNYLLVGEYGDPIDSNGDPAASIYRSSDGTTWETSFTGSTSMRHIHDVAHDPYVGGQVWAAAGDAGNPDIILRSTDNGASWTTVVSNHDWQSVQINFTEDYVLLAPDAGRATLFVYHRASGEMSQGTSAWHVFYPVPTWWYEDTNPKTFYDGAMTDGSTTLTSGAAAFEARDDGRPIRGQGIPAGTTVSNVVSATEVALSQPASSPPASAIFTVDRLPDMFFWFCLVGVKDQQTGVYYTVSSAGPPPQNTYGVFAIPNVGGQPVLLGTLSGAPSNLQGAFLSDSSSGDRFLFVHDWRFQVPAGWS